MAINFQPQDTRAKSKKLSLGEVLIEEGVLTVEDLARLLALQKQDTRPLGEICMDQGFLSRHTLRFILKKYHHRMMIGELLVAMGIIRAEQLRDALSEQKQGKKRIGEVLIDKNLITDEDLATVLSEQLGIPRMVPDPALVDPALLDKISHRFMMSNDCLPMHIGPEGITVIMADPLATETLENLHSVYNEKVLTAVATRNEIVQCLGLLTNQQTLDRHLSTVPSGLAVQKDLTIEFGDSSIELDRIVSMVNYIIFQAVAEGASDVHLEPQEDKLKVRYRIDGVLRTKTDLPRDTAPAIVSRIKALGKINIAEKRRHQDGRMEAKILGKEVDLRIATYPSIHGEALVIRILNRNSYLMALEQLGLSPANFTKYSALLDNPSGMILVTGPTGSGKTTTLYASLQVLVDRGLSIITVEDPVEYTLNGVVQGGYESKLGLSYADYIKAMMRQDPDVIMVGEMRDAETAKTAVRATLTGHKVLSTLHTDDTTGALIRLVDLGVENSLIGSTIQGVLTQRLLRTICHHCKEEAAPDPKALAHFGLLGRAMQGLTFYRGRGCQRCGHSGYKGRVGVHELLTLNDAVRDGLYLRKTSSELRQLARVEADLISMMEDALYKAIKGLTTIEEALRVLPLNEASHAGNRDLARILQQCAGESHEAVWPAQLAAMRY